MAGRAPITLRVVGTAMMGRVNVVVNPRTVAENDRVTESILYYPDRFTCLLAGRHLPSC